MTDRWISETLRKFVPNLSRSARAPLSAAFCSSVRSVRRRAVSICFLRLAAIVCAVAPGGSKRRSQASRLMPARALSRMKVVLAVPVGSEISSVAGAVGTALRKKWSRAPSGGFSPLKNRSPRP